MTTPNPDFDIDAYMHAHVLRSVTSDFWKIEADGTDIMLNTTTCTQLDPGGAIEMAAALIALAALAQPAEDEETAHKLADRLAHHMREDIREQRHLDTRAPAA